MYIEEIRSKSDEDLRAELDESHVELMHLRFRWATRQITNVYELKKVRKKIARINTILRERELGITNA
ncbi:MAG: 50S ribosomal protein L29 [Candidatus Brocadiia bacterium]|jgi:large subunit ribosomal protein L29|nr:50S ribosomal protein L29 [Candidatus Brocadiia bacterium]